MEVCACGSEARNAAQGAHSYKQAGVLACLETRGKHWDSKKKVYCVPEKIRRCKDNKFFARHKETFACNADSSERSAGNAEKENYCSCFFSRGAGKGFSGSGYNEAERHCKFRFAAGSA